jgi:hypothetical protein
MVSNLQSEVVAYSLTYFVLQRTGGKQPWKKGDAQVSGRRVWFAG